MVETTLTALLMGLSLSLMIGPAFFGLLLLSAFQGKKVGFYYALGIYLADLTIVGLFYFLTERLSKLMENTATMKFGALILAITGIFLILKKPKEKSSAAPRSKNVLASGYLLNILNPSVYFIWMGFTAACPNSDLILIYLTTIATTNFIIDLIKIRVANLLDNKLPQKLINASNYVVPFVFITTGILVFIKNL